MPHDIRLLLYSATVMSRAGTAWQEGIAGQIVNAYIDRWRRVIYNTNIRSGLAAWAADVARHPYKKMDPAVIGGDPYNHYNMSLSGSCGGYGTFLESKSALINDLI